MMGDKIKKKSMELCICHRSVIRMRRVPAIWTRSSLHLVERLLALCPSIRGLYSRSFWPHHLDHISSTSDDLPAISLAILWAMSVYWSCRKTPSIVPSIAFWATLSFKFLLLHYFDSLLSYVILSDKLDSRCRNPSKVVKLCWIY